MKHAQRVVTLLVIVVSALATVIVSVGATASAPRICGDMDGDGKLTTYDVRDLMCRMIGGTITAEERALMDCDGNNKLDTRDARTALRVVTGLNAPVTVVTTTTTVATTTTTKPDLDDDGFYDDVIKP
ncbi:MAG: hypothetical protein IJB27_07435 [Clostridia bacterium]|nr:hypothetical protein [Clostridia bacterium]